ncbi:hypothetical protein B194_3082 [Serratia plymuthica A30]|nr:hypothetical protein B194_3082 [Serratia plymuthica A30]
MFIPFSLYIRYSLLPFLKFNFPRYYYFDGLNRIDYENP